MLLFISMFAYELVFSGRFELPIRQQSGNLLEIKSFEMFERGTRIQIPDQIASKLGDAINDYKAWQNVSESKTYLDRNGKKQTAKFVKLKHPSTNEDFWVSVNYLLSNDFAQISDTDCTDGECHEPQTPSNAAIDRIIAMPIPSTSTKKTNAKVTPSCEFLVLETKENISKLFSDNMIRKCLKAIATKLNKGKGHKGKLSLLYDLTKEEQNFMALIFTSLGEVSHLESLQKPGDFMIIFKTLEDRYNDAKNNQNLTLVDIALENKQFSMYNHNIKPPHVINWLNYIEKGLNVNKSSAKITKAIQAYKKYINGVTVTSNDKPIDKITHFYGAYMRRPPKWARKMTKRTNIKINGEPVTTSRSGHIYLTGYYSFTKQYTVAPPRNRKIISGGDSL